MAKLDDCIGAMKDAIDEGSLSRDEMRGILDRMQARADARLNENTHNRLEDDLLDESDRIKKDIEEARAIEKRNLIKNRIIYRRAMDLAALADKEFGDPSLALEAMLVGVTQNLKDGRKSVDARGKALAREYMGGMIADLRKRDLLEVFISREMEDDLAIEIAAMTDPSITRTGNKQAREMAEVFHKYRTIAISRSNRAGTWIRPAKGYVLRQSHDAHRIRAAGYQAWKDTIEPLLDPRTFGDSSPEDFLQSTWDALSSGVHLRALGAEDTDLKFAFQGPGNLAKRVSQHRVIHFKDPQSFMAYNREFGSRELTDGIFHDLERIAQNTALMETFGTNPQAMLDRIVTDLKKKHRTEPDKLARLERGAFQRFMNVVDGSYMVPQNSTGASVSAGLRAIQSMSKLGGAVLSAITDLAFGSTEIAHQGRHLLSAWGRALGNVVEGMAPGESRHAADLIGVGLDGILGDIYLRFSSPDGGPGAMAKGMRLFFKFNGLGPWTDANKRGFGLMMARDFARMAESDFSGLSDIMQTMLKRYGIGESEWEVARLGLRKADDGRVYLFPDEVRNLDPNEVLSGIQNPRARRNKLDEIATSLQSLYVDRADFSTPTPGAREQAWLTWGTQRGTAVGEAIRFISQFKAFPVTVITRNAKELLYSQGAKTFRESVLRGKGDMIAFANMLVGATALGYLAGAAKDMAKGREPRDPSDPKTWGAAFVQGGGAGLYGDFLFGEYNRFGRSLLDSLAGPTLGSVDDLGEIWAAAVRGEDFGAKSLRFMLANTPFINLFYTRTALDYLFLYQMQEWVNPGYLQRMERTIKEENDQQFMLPPSRTIPRGGGDRLLEGVRE